MNLYKVTMDNWHSEDLCCGPSSSYAGVYHKKQWLRQAFVAGLVFLRTEEPTRAMIEYMPAEEAWLPLDANGYLVILCFRVRDPDKCQGIGKALLDACIEDAKLSGKKGVIAITSSSKRPYLSDGNYLKKYGFRVVDTALDSVELLAYSFENSGASPKIKDCAKVGQIQEQGMVIYYTPQCVFTETQIDLLQYAFKRQKLLLNVHRYLSKEEAQNAPCPFTTYSVFINGKFYSHEILREKAAQALSFSHHL